MDDQRRPGDIFYDIAFGILAAIAIGVGVFLLIG